MLQYRVLGLCLFIVLVSVPVRAQDSTATDSSRSWYEDSWTTIVDHKGVHFDYVFYSKADSENNGVVIRLTNQNPYPIQYEFTVLFRGPDAEAEATASGVLRAGEMKTGEADGLFWIPFKEGNRVGEIGLRGIEITRVDPEEGSPSSAVKAPWRLRARKTV